MRTSSKGLALIQSYESCRLKAYPDPKTGGSPWTCGWGCTGTDIGPTTVWTQQQADTRFVQDVARFEDIVNTKVTRAGMTQGQFDAFVSIVFNVGPGGSQRDGIIRLKSGKPSTLLRKFLAGDDQGCAAEWVKWISPGTNVSAGLLKRRQAELDQLFWAKC